MLRGWWLERERKHVLFFALFTKRSILTRCKNNIIVRLIMSIVLSKVLHLARRMLKLFIVFKFYLYRVIVSLEVEG